MAKTRHSRDQQARLLLTEATFQRILEQSKTEHATPGFQSSYRNGASLEAIRARPLRDALQQAIRWAEIAYTLEWETAQWYNNNMPGVGQTIDYRSVPDPPPWLAAARTALANYDNPEKLNDTI